MGSVFWPMVASNQLLWAAEGRLVFPWERDGWQHLYSVAADGGNALPLTPGNFEIEHVALSHDGKSVVYSSNNGDLDRRHLWSVPVAGGTQQPLTPGTGIEWMPAPLAGGQLALLRADARSPSRASLMDASGKIRDLATATMPADFPAGALVEPQQVVFPAADGMQIHGQLFLPSNAGSGKHPAVIFFHGGSRRQMLLGWHYMFYYHQAYGFNQYLASKGYVVLSVNYRSGIGMVSRSGRQSTTGLPAAANTTMLSGRECLSETGRKWTPAASAFGAALMEAISRRWAWRGRLRCFRWASTFTEFTNGTWRSTTAWRRPTDRKSVSRSPGSLTSLRRWPRSRHGVRRSTHPGRR